ncbi:MAG: ABC transporter ATP-binding protein [Leucobacter sp.]
MREALLRGSDISVSYRGVKAVRNVSIEVRPGEVLGLIGPNGAGKTSIIDGISGFTPIEGSVELCGNSLDRAPAFRRRRRGLSRTWQSVALFDDLTLLENVTITSGASGDAAPRGRATRSEGLEKLAMVGLGAHAHRLPGELSHGQRVLVGIARALTGSPRVLLLDEPAAGLDDHESRALIGLIREFVTLETGLLLVDHDMGLMMTVCDRLQVLDFGSTIAEGAPEAIATDPVVVAAYLGTALESDSEQEPHPAGGER